MNILLLLFLKQACQQRSWNFLIEKDSEEPNGSTVCWAT